MSVVAKRVLFQRDDGRWGWQLVVNDEVVATDGGRGYESKGECRTMADRVIAGYYINADRRIRTADPPVAE